MIVALVGLAREARLVAGPDVKPAVGEAALRAAVAAGARGIISIGVAGGLDPALKTGDIVIASHVVSGSDRYPSDAAWSDAIARHLPEARRGTISGSDVIIASHEAKAALYRESAALAVDMESHLGARVAQAAGLPFAALRVILDIAETGLPPAALRARRENGTINLGAVLASVISDVSQIPALMRTARDAEIAFGALLRCRRALGPGLACPYLG